VGWEERGYGILGLIEHDVPEIPILPRERQKCADSDCGGHYPICYRRTELYGGWWVHAWDGHAG
jgi:hypothetical protein